MVVGVCRIRLAIPENASLKGKRKVVKRVISRVRSTFNVAVAEIEDNDFHSTAVLGLVAVGNDHRFINSTLDKISNFIEELYLAEVEEFHFEIIHF
ncbi:MAG: DUF503 domain-containing protein [Deltaproteobacteria bacterium]|nr:DUF503 domain-containing protein [Deltaproteobacteria bacterium]